MLCWKPGDVVPRNRGRAVCLWFILIASIIAYASFLINAAVEGKKNPSTSFVTSNEGYKYPDVLVCPYEGYGCDRQEDEGDCVYSSSTTHGETKGTFNPESDEELDIELLADLTDTSVNKGFCVTFYASKLGDADGDPNPDPEDYVLFEVSWYPGGVNGASNTCIHQQGEWASHSESITVFLRDSDTGALSAGMQLPYSCMTNQTTSHVFNYLGIGLTKKVGLDSSHDSTTYRALITYSSPHKDAKSDVADIYNPYAHFSLEVAQEINSLEVITEIDPLAIAEIFGEVGGAWDLLLLLWPIFFVFAVPKEPEYKGRNFRKTAKKGTRFVRSVTSSVGFSAPHEQRLPARGSSASLQNSHSTVSPSANVTTNTTIGSSKVTSSRALAVVNSRNDQNVRLRVQPVSSRGSPPPASPRNGGTPQPASVIFTV